MLLVVGEATEFELHVFECLHQCVEIEVFDIDGHESGAGVGDNATEKEFDSEKVHGWCVAVAGVVDSFSTNGESCSVWVDLF